MTESEKEIKQTVVPPQRNGEIHPPKILTHIKKKNEEPKIIEDYSPESNA